MGAPTKFLERKHGANRNDCKAKPKARSTRKPKHQHHPDTIRIVPLHVAGELGRPSEEARAAGPTPPPHLSYRGGPLLANVKVFTVFWGSSWKGSQASLVTRVNAFFDYILTSPLIDQLVEYNVPAYTIGHGSHVGGTITTTPKPPHSITDADLQAFLQKEIAGNTAFPKPDANTLYFLYMPPGVRVVQGGSASCSAFCGYHNDIGGKIFYAVMPFPAAPAASAASTPQTPSPRRARMSYARRSPTPSPERAGTTTRTARSATSAPGRRKLWAASPCSSNGRINRASASSRS